MGERLTVPLILFMEDYIMACANVCRLCNRFIISDSVAFTGGNLVINIPAGTYENGEKYCIVVAQSIPTTTTISAPVYVTIGAGTTLYPLTNRCCAQLTACGIRTRTRYSTVVVTNATGGSFRLLGRPACAPNNALTAIDGDTATATEGA